VTLVRDLHDGTVGIVSLQIQRVPAGVVAITALAAISCGRGVTSANAGTPPPSCSAVSVVRLTKKNLERQLTVSSEFVPFQQIDLFAKEAGFVRKLNVDYGSHVKTGDVMAVLEIPELQLQLEEDDALIAEAAHEISRAQKEVDRVAAQRDVERLEFTRLDAVAKSRPGLVAQQEVDDRRGKYLAGEAQVAAAESVLQAARSQYARNVAKRRRDQALFDYSKIVAPFDGVVTQRYANLGTLMQAGTNSSTHVLPLVQLSEDDKFRLVIPIPESYVGYVRVGDPVDVRVPSLNQHFPGRVARSSLDVKADTRTMHTEVDVPNPRRVLMPGVYAEATLKINGGNAVAVPLEAVVVEGDRRTVWVIGPSNRVELRTVTLGIETPDDAEVLSGLSQGERVAVGDRSNLRPGETVCPKEVQLIRYRGDQP